MHYTVLPLDELIARIGKGRSLRGCCGITFDDGFRDFATFAYPILVDLGIPVTHFLTTDGLLTGRPTWNYRLNRILHFVRVSHGFEPSPRGNTPPAMTEMMRMKRLFDTLSVEDRVVLLDGLERSIPMPSDPPMLCASDLRLMGRSLVQWGSHTVTHPTLPMCVRDRLSFELSRSREILESVIGERVLYLAYPNSDYDERTIAAAIESGYIASFTAQQRRFHPGTPMHAIPRFDVGGLPRDMVALELALITPFLRRVLRG